MASWTQWTWVEHTPGDGEGQGSQACCSPWDHKVRYNLTTEQQTMTHRNGLKSLTYDVCFLWSAVILLMFDCMVFCFFSQQKLLYVLALSSDSSVGKESAWNAGNPSTIPVLGRSTGDGILQYSWASLVTQLVKNLPAMWEIWVWSLGWEDPVERERLPTPIFWPGYPLQYSGLGNSMDGIVHGVAESETEQLSLSQNYLSGCLLGYSPQ